MVLNFEWIFGKMNGLESSSLRITTNPILIRIGGTMIALDKCYPMVRRVGLITETDLFEELWTILCF